MTLSLTSRWAAYIAAVVLVLFFIGWASHNSWQTIQHLGDAASWQLRAHPQADHFLQAVLKTRGALVAFRWRHDPASWKDFQQSNQSLTESLNQLSADIDLPPETPTLANLRELAQEYARRTTALKIPEETTPRSSNVEADRPELDRLDLLLNQMLQAGALLDDAQMRALGSYLAQTRIRLVQLRAQFWGLLGLLLALGTIVAMMVYRGMVAPLRVKLVESRQLADRHEKLAALGMLAAGVAHEIRNPLTAIKARLFTLRRNLEAGTRPHRDAEVIDQEINRLERIVKDFLLFARPSEPKFAVVSADRPLVEIQTLMSPQLEKFGITVKLEIGSTAAVRMDDQQIKQVLMNLVQNAAESIGSKGTITLRTCQRSARLAGQPRKVVVLEVADTGQGIPPEVEERLFDPFFTTKEGGTGLGLAIAAGIVEKHGGALEYQTSPGQGTAFGIVLPAGG